MSAYRDFLCDFYGPEAGVKYDAAVAEAGRLLAASLADALHDGLLTEPAAA